MYGRSLDPSRLNGRRSPPSARGARGVYERSLDPSRLNGLRSPLDSLRGPVELSPKFLADDLLSDRDAEALRGASERRLSSF